MTIRRKSVASALLALALLLGVAGVAQAATPPYEPDPGAVGSLTFYDSSGNIITTGSVNDAPFAAYVSGSHAGRNGDYKATLFGYLPKNGQQPTAWSGEALTGSTAYAVGAGVPTAPVFPGGLAGTTLPVTTVTGGDLTLANLASDFPNTATDAYQGLYQLRLKTSGTQTAGAEYDAASILISGTTWTQVYPTPASQATTTTLAVTPPSPQNAGAQVTLTATVTPANAAGSVQFTDGATAIGGPVAVAAGLASTSTSGLSVGTHTLTATFTPTNPASNPTAFAASTSNAVPYVISVAPAAPTTTGLAVNTGTGAAFSPVVLTATVTPANAPGTVTFADGASVLGTTAAGQGTFTLTTSALAEGSHTITATFNPTNPGTFASSTVTGTAFSLTAAQYAPAVGNFRAAIAAGTLVISTPYTPGAPLDLGTLVLNSAATQYSGSATFSGISITDTRAGNLPWTVSALSSALSNGSAGSINGQNVGLTNLIATELPGNALTAASVATFNNPAASPAVDPAASGNAGLGGGAPHTVLSAVHGAGSISFSGTLTLNAPTSSPPGSYAGTITFTIG
jgi:hypothetical protein